MAESEEQARPDLSGYWKLQRNDENFEKYLQVVGVNFVVRKLIKGASVSQDIEQNGDSFHIKTILPISTQEQKFTIGEPYDFYNNFSKVTIQRVAKWEGDTLAITSSAEGANEERRLIEDGLLVLVLSKGGVTTRRYFEKAEKK